MNPVPCRLRTATPDDAAAILAVYAPYVRHTAVTFEYTVPTLEEFRGRMERTLRKYPYLVAEQDGEILGYAYTGAFRSRPAYGWAAETTIYLREDLRRRGLGRRLYTALETISAAQHVFNLNACISYPLVEDEYLTRNSAEFHARMGYRLVGEFNRCAYRFGRWYNMRWMEKIIGEHPAAPPPVIPFPELPPAVLHAAGLTV